MPPASSIKKSPQKEEKRIEELEDRLLERAAVDDNEVEKRLALVRPVIADQRRAAEEQRVPELRPELRARRNAAMHCGCGGGIHRSGGHAPAERPAKG